MTIFDAEAVNRLYAAFDEQDLATMDLLIDPDIVWHVPGRSRLAGTVRGREALYAWFAEVWARTHGSFAIAVEACGELGPHDVSVLSTASATLDGELLTSRFVQVYRVRDGRIVEHRAFSEDQEVLDRIFRGDPAAAVPAQGGREGLVGLISANSPSRRP